MSARAAIVSKEASIDEAARRMGEMLASAIRHGALLDEARWAGWIEGVQHHMMIDGSLLSIELPPIGDAVQGRWFADPVTALLIVRWHRDGLTLPSGTPPEVCLARVSARECREGLASIDSGVERAIEAWRFRLPGLLHAHAEGKVSVTSVPKATWTRIIYGVELPREAPVRVTGNDAAVAPSALKKLLAPDLAALSEAERRTCYEAGKDAAKRTKKIAAALIEANPVPSSPVAAALHDWAIYALRHQEGGRASIGYATKTMRRYLKAIAPVLDDWRTCPFQAPAEILEEHVLHVMSSVPQHHRAPAVNALRAFGHYANTRRQAPLELELDGLVKPSPVAADLVLPEVYRLARQTLLRRNEEDGADCLTLMFRAGLRPNEVAGLRTGDLAVAGDRVELIVEDNDERALKTRTSRRILPLDIFLEDDEVARLVSRAGLRIEACGAVGEAWLFGSAMAVSPPFSAALSLPVMEALRQAAGSAHLKLNHLRHSFASYLLATLLLPQDATDAAVPARLASVVSPQRFTRIVDRLLGHQRLGAGALHSVSQLMGHTGPATTLEHYCHLLDLSLGLYCARPGALGAIDPSWLTAMLGISPDASRKALSRATARISDVTQDGSSMAVRPDAAAILTTTPHIGRKLAQVRLLDNGMRRAARPLARSLDAQARVPSMSLEAAGDTKESSVKIPPYRAPTKAWPVPWRMILHEPHRAAWDEAIDRLTVRGGAELKDEAPSDPVSARFVDRHLVLKRRPWVGEREALFRVVYRFKHGRRDIRLCRLGDAVAFVRLLDVMGFQHNEVDLALTSALGAELNSAGVRCFLNKRSEAPRLAGRSGWRGSLVVRLRPVGLERPIVAARACRFALTMLAIDLMAACPSLNAGLKGAHGTGRRLARARPTKRKKLGR